MQEKRPIGLTIFAIVVDVFICIIILCGAWLLNKEYYAPLFIIAFRMVRVIIEKQYKILHCSTITLCILSSFALCVAGMYMSLPYNISFIAYIITGGIVGYFTYLVSDYRERKKLLRDNDFETYITTILNRFNIVGNNRKIMLLYHVDMRTPHDIWLWYIDNVEYVEPESINKRILRLNKKVGLKSHKKTK